MNETWEYIGHPETAEIPAEEENVHKPSETVPPVRKSGKSRKAVQEFLGGDYLNRDRVVRNIPFLFYIAFLAMLYIGNTYYTEKKLKDIERTKNEIKELRFHYIAAKSELMFLGRQSEISKRARTLGLKENITPPYKIVYSNASFKTGK
jgi:hypothetical protein